MSASANREQRPVTIGELLRMKESGERIVALTAYDYLLARIVDDAGVDVVLVGDSLGTVVLGHDSTIPVTLDDMIHHARAVRRGVTRALLVVDLPFLTYPTSADALRSAGRVLQQTGAAAVKLEGGSEQTAETVRALVRSGIPVMGHLGFTPQSEHTLGRARVQGRDDGDAARLREEAGRLEDAGAFSVVLELLPGALARDITAALRVPTIGIGAGPGCDGQVLVLPDMLGLNPDFRPRFLRRFAELGEQAREGIAEYARSVRDGTYPAAEHTWE
ncbi:3-methyl-2-oxobutanoate hydroxymethyltransferase [soil metagenome]